MADEDVEPYVPPKKVFVANSSGFVGRNLSKRFAAAGFEVLGTLNASAPKPLAVSRVVDTKPASLVAAFLESEITVLDCLGDMEMSEAILAAISQAGQLETPKVLVGVSSIMAWARTSPNADEPERPLTESDYKTRRPHGNYKELVSLEKLVTKSKREGLRAHVVAAGLTYGEEEDLFHTLFKTAWSNAALPLLSMSDGSNVLPTIHVTDLCSVVLKLLESDSLPYLIAVDSPEAPQTLAGVVRALSKELGTGEVLAPPARDSLLLMPDYEFFQVGAPIGDTPGLKLAAAAINDLGIEWHSKEGMLAHMPKVVEEYRSSRGLQPLRLLVHGNDELAKSELAAALVAEYKLPYVLASAAVAEAAGKGDALAAEVAAAGGNVSDELMGKVLTAALTTTTCRNQGYVLQGFPKSLAQASFLFPTKPAGAEGEEPPPPPEEGAPPPPLAAAAPEFVITLEADEAVIKEKQLALSTPAMTEDQLGAMLTEYAATNAEDSPTSVLALPALKGVEVLGPLQVKATTAADALLSKARVYLGQPRNYGPTEEEIAAKKALEEAEAAEAKRHADEQKAAQARADAAERKRREEHESTRAAEVKQQESELLEVRSIPLRNYLMANVIPTLTEGLIEVCKVKPEDPVDYIAEYLFKNNPQDEESFA